PIGKLYSHRSHSWCFDPPAVHDRHAHGRDLSEIEAEFGGHSLGDAEVNRTRIDQRAYRNGLAGKEVSESQLGVRESHSHVSKGSLGTCTLTTADCPLKAASLRVCAEIS